MSTHTTICAYGCKVTGQHVTDCHTDDCRGCLPRPSDTGTLCAWCWRHLVTDLADVTPLVAHLREIGKPYAQTNPPGDGRTYADPAESTVIPAAWLAADELASLVESWAHVLIEEHPAGLSGPHRAPWHGDVVTWLQPHLEWCAGQDWVTEMRREFARDVSTLKARWPTIHDVERTRPVHVPCPRCDQMSLTYTPPRYTLQPFIVQCDNPDCARVFSEDEWDRFKALALQVKA